METIRISLMVVEETVTLKLRMVTMHLELKSHPEHSNVTKITKAKWEVVEVTITSLTKISLNRVEVMKISIKQEGEMANIVDRITLRDKTGQQESIHILLKVLGRMMNMVAAKLGLMGEAMSMKALEDDCQYRLEVITQKVMLMVEIIQRKELWMQRLLVLISN